jgi:2-amino-4-hydroxy-6-hydroxymethyldihydropteridine diphosphokinase
MTQIFLSLGSNQGDRFSFLEKAVFEIEDRVGKLVSCSSYFETEPWGFNTKTYFINQVVELNTNFAPLQLLEEILGIERKLGRTRKLSNLIYTDRCIDIDILLYGNQLIEFSNLSIPHKFMHERKFVLKPLNEIAPNLIHPVLKRSINHLLLNCNDKTDVKKYYGKPVIQEQIQEG